MIFSNLRTCQAKSASSTKKDCTLTDAALVRNLTALRNFYHFGRLGASREGVKHAVKLARTVRGVERVAAPYVSERILQRPEVAILEVFVFGRVPLTQNVSNLSLATRTSLEAAQDQIVCDAVVDADRLVIVDASIVSDPRIGELTNGASDDRGKVAHNVGSVAATQHNLVRENEVGKTKGASPAAMPARKALS